jgi:asparagine synthase (glutamine-hydrolysing)
MISINFQFLPSNDIVWISEMSSKGKLDKLAVCNVSDFIEFDLLLNDNICNYSAVKYFAQEKVIIAKRDFFGTIPLFFKWEKGGFCFLSDSLSELLYSGDIEVNEERINYYLNSDDLDELQKTHLTFFENIYQVPAGCIARINANGVEISSLNYVRTVDTKTLTDVIKANLGEALINCNKVSYNVSGGIDSTGLASIHEFYLSSVIEATFCALVPSFESCKEKEFQRSFEERFNREIEYFEINTSIKEITESYVHYSLHPPLLYSLVSVFDSILNGLNAKDVDKLIMGHGGDNVLGHGYECITDLLKEKNYDDIKKFVEKVSKGNILKSKYKDWDSFSASKKFSISLLYFVFPSMKENVKYFPDFLWNYLKIGGSMDVFFSSVFRLIGNKFKLRPRLFKVRSVVKTHDLFKINYQPTRYSNIQNWVTSSTLEVFHHLSRLCKKDFVFPYFSTELLATSLTYTDKEKFGEGLGRAHFRAELKGIMPEKVRNRIGKTSFDELFVSEIQNYIRQVGHIPDNHRLWKYVHSETYQKIVGFLLSDDIQYHEKVRNAHLIHRTLNLKVWLDCIYKF